MKEDIEFVLKQLLDYGKIELGTEASKKLIQLLNNLEKESSSS